MAGVRHRQGEAGGGAEAGASAPEDIATTIAGRIADDLALIAQHPDEAEVTSPSLEEPWDVSAADELARIYASGEAGLAEPLSADCELQLRLAQTVAQAAALRPAAREGASGWEALDARLAEMARTVEAALARIAAAESPAAKTTASADAERLTLIESQLRELRASLSPDRIAGIIEAAVPTEDALARVADSAAQKALRGRREATSDLAATARLNERSGEIHRLLTGLVDEQRQSGHQVAEALETMQQAMQHILERIDAIEVAQTAAFETMPDGPEQRESPSPPQAGRVEVFGSMQEARARAGFAAGIGPARKAAPGSDIEAAAALPGPAWDDLSLGDYRSQGGPFGGEELADRVVGRAGVVPPSGEPRAADIGPLPSPRTAGPPAETANGSAPARPGLLLAASLAAFLLAGYWLVSGPRLRLPDAAGTQSAEQRPGAETMPGAPPALRLFSVTPDLDGGRAGRRKSAGFGSSEQPIEHGTLGGRNEHPGEQLETQAQSAVKDAAGAAPPMGVVIDEGGPAMSAEELLALRHKQRMAKLSTRMGQQAAIVTVQPVTVSASETDSRQADARQDADQPSERGSVELPPLMIGPHSLRHAAAGGNAAAQFEVAARFAQGKGVKQDLVLAAKWYQRAATQGLAAAQYRLAALYERGLGVSADTARAKAWYRRAAEQGNLKAMHNLAVLSAGNGDSGVADYATAGRWFAEAADRGLADSQYNLGILHENGLGVAKDLSAAYKWYALAARSGDNEAVRRRDFLKETLGAAALRAAEAEVAAWQALPADPLANDARLAGQAWQGRSAGSRN